MNGNLLGLFWDCIIEELRDVLLPVFVTFITLAGLLTVLVLSLMAVSGCGPSLKDFPRVLIHNDSAVIVVPETKDPKAKLYYISRQDDKWDLRQTIDLTPHLDGWFCNLFSYSETFDRQGDEETKQVHAIAMNDRWLAISVCEKRPHNNPRDKSLMKQNGVLLFTKMGGMWGFHSKLVPQNSLWDVNVTTIPFIALTDNDQLLIASPWHLEGERVGALYCYQLNIDSEPVLSQTLLPPKEQFREFIDSIANAKYGISATGFATEFFIAGDLLLICDQMLPLLREPTKNDMYSSSKDMFVYESVNGNWEYRFCYRDVLGKDDKNGDLYYDYASRRGHYIFSNGSLFSYVGERDFGKNEMTYEILKLKYADGKVLDVSTDSLVTQDDDAAPMLQLPDTYILKWLGHYERFALTPPSDDQDGHFTAPKWTVFDSDERTYNLVADTLKKEYYYSTYYKGEKMIKEKKNTYENVEDIPIVKQSIDKNRIITSYAFPHCYDDDYPTLQDAEVWAGVNIYEIDPETGPKRVFRMTTSHNRDLEVVPVSEEHP